MSPRSRKGRPVDGILLFDKPTGLSSNAALQQVKRLFSAQKAGHTGSLDPLASGLLPICLGEATKASTFLLDADKRYLVSARLGLRTATGDCEGGVIAEAPIPALDDDAIQTALGKFVGEQQQVPPMYSALKRQGQPLYALARRGIEVERAARTIRIHELRLRGWTADTLELEILCSKGTYVRTLVEDIGTALGSCAHVANLRRTAAGRFGPNGLCTLEQLEALAGENFEGLDRCLLPVEAAFEGWPEVELDRDSAWYLQRGQAVQAGRRLAPGLLCLYGPGRRFLGLGEALEDGRVTPHRLLRAEPAERAGNT